MNKKANILATILIIGAILSGVVIYSTTTMNKPFKASDMPDLSVQVDYLVETAILEAIRDFVKYGYSKYEADGALKGTDVWYCDDPIPPSVGESTTAFNKYVEDKIYAIIDRINSDYKDQGYNVNKPSSDDIVVEGVEGVTDINALPKDKVTVTINNFRGSISQGGQTQTQDLSKKYEFDFRMWHIYEKMQEWVQNDAAELQLKLFEAMSAEDCETRKCCCNTAGQAAQFSQAEIAQIIQDKGLQAADVEAKIQLSIDELNTKFAGENIECEFEVEKSDVDNLPEYYENNAQATGTANQYSFDCISICNNNGDTIQLDLTNPNAPDTPEMFYGVSDNIVVPSSTRGSDGNVGCPTLVDMADMDARPTRYTRSIDWLVQDTFQAKNSQASGFSANNPSNLFMGLRKKAAYLYTVRCNDKDAVIETDEGITPFSPEMRIRFRVQFECPKQLSVLAIEDICGGGGSSCFPAGTMITMADNSKKPIEEIQVGDKVLSYDIENDKLVGAEVTELESPMREGIYTLTFDDGTDLKTTNEHPLYISKDGNVGWGAIDPSATKEEVSTLEVMKIDVGDKVMGSSLAWKEIVDISYEEGTTKTYNLIGIEKINNFFADDVLAHNKVVEIPCSDIDVCLQQYPQAGVDCLTCVLDSGGQPVCDIEVDSVCADCTICNANTGACDQPFSQSDPLQPCDDCGKCDTSQAGVCNDPHPDYDTEFRKCFSHAQCDTYCTSAGCNNINQELNTACTLRDSSQGKAISGKPNWNCNFRYDGTCESNTAGDRLTCIGNRPSIYENQICCSGTWCAAGQECCNIQDTTKWECGYTCDWSSG